MRLRRPASIPRRRPRPGPRCSTTPRSCTPRATTCGFTTSWITWVQIEQFSAWHNVPIGTKANGLDGFDTVLEFNTPSRRKPLQNLVELQKDKTFDYSRPHQQPGEGRFTSAANARIDFNVVGLLWPSSRRTPSSPSPSAPMPYYPDVKGAPQNSIIGGATLWVMGGKKPEEYKGVAQFFTFLSRHRPQQVHFHEMTGYLPITKAAYETTKASGFYEKNPGLDIPVMELTNKPPTENSRGLRFGNLVQIRDVIAEEIEAALAGKKPAKEALDTAVKRGNDLSAGARLRGGPCACSEGAWKTRRSSGHGCCPICWWRRSSRSTLVFFFWPAAQALWQSVPARRTPFGLSTALRLVRELRRAVQRSRLSCRRSCARSSSALPWRRSSLALVAAAGRDGRPRASEARTAYKTLLICPMRWRRRSRACSGSSCSIPALGMLARALQRSASTGIRCSTARMRCCSSSSSRSGSRSATISCSSSPACSRFRNR